jgi:hypothetical protein
MEAPKQPKPGDQPSFPPEVLLKVLEAAHTPVATIAAVSRSLQQAVLVQDPRRLNLFIDPADSTQLATGLHRLVWLSHSSSKNGEPQKQCRAGPLRVVLRNSACSRDDLSIGMCTGAARVLLHTPLRWSYT